ncbi:DUF4935 domain-containing protein [Shimia sp. R9_1]|uniref:PIN-like domain-containing protein n=1 Tax=Shimia sp. R9_1 TaxID=2821111 RepID=UPI001ADB0020|nr:PIN-like domain-containing protein [Shimia sp. R9_1]MBO9408515.1 DUF4935 domain-containing protein [Shimia sp. R9_1]
MNLKERFWANHPLTAQVKREIWRDAIFTFDTSVLLDLYRFSETTRAEVFEILEVLGDRAWLTAQVAKEVYAGRLGAIRDEVNAYDPVVEYLSSKHIGQKLLRPLGKRRHPYVSQDTFDELKAVIEKVRAEVKEERSALEDLAANDPILPKLSEQFGVRVGPEFDDADLEKHRKEALRRVKERVPPGYADETKSDDLKVGDYFVWRQAMDLSSARAKHLVFVTSDKKEDWWQLYGKGEQARIVGPRPELLSEFKDDTGHSVLMLELDEFLSLFADFEHRAISDQARQEAAAVSLNEARRAFRLKRKFKEFYVANPDGSVSLAVPPLGSARTDGSPFEEEEKRRALWQDLILSKPLEELRSLPRQDRKFTQEEVARLLGKHATSILFGEEHTSSSDGETTEPPEESDEEQ